MCLWIIASEMEDRVMRHEIERRRGVSAIVRARCGSFLGLVRDASWCCTDICSYSC